MTYSIVARCAETGRLGAAVQSCVLGVGALTLWAEPGVGAVETQAFIDPSYGPKMLSRLSRGEVIDAALEELVRADRLSVTRQVAAVDSAGNVTVHTGRRCVVHAGHSTGDGFSCQANMMRNPGVPEAMADAFASAEGDLDGRLLVALDAAEGIGGDIRGRESAALLVVDASPDAPMLGRLVDLRVDDHPDPLAELRRLNRLRRALGPDQDAELASELGHGNPQGWFWKGVRLAGDGDTAGARAALDRAYAVDEGWRELLQRLGPTGALRIDKDVIEELTR